MAEIIEVERLLGFILKEKQKEVIAAFVEGNVVFVVLPVGCPTITQHTNISYKTLVYEKGSRIVYNNNRILL